MKFLLDTSVFLWSLDADYKLNTRAKQILIAPSQELFLSAVSAWEIAIKFARGSLPFPKAPSEYISVALRTWGCERSISLMNMHCAQANAQHIIGIRLTVCS
jgi:PIN domain nuclease of toxin-antitoxin system